MATPKVFVTGATGYIGGDALYEIYKAHPEWHYTALVRNSDKGALVAKEYPKIRLVYGDLNNSALLEEECKNADIVLHFASADEEPGARAIAKGLTASSHTTYWIHTSGTGILTFPTADANAFGESMTKSYDDVDNIADLISLPDHALHRNVDKVVLAVGSADVKTAIVCPPTIYGAGRGPGNQRSIQIPGMSRAFIQRQEGFHVGAGQNIWTNVHVHDLSNAFLLLAEAAASGGGKASWNNEGYYFTENGTHVWGDVSQEIAKRGHKLGILASDKVSSISPDEADKYHMGGRFLWGSNSIGKASRARKLLGWTPKGVPYQDTLEQVLKNEKASVDRGEEGPQKI